MADEFYGRAGRWVARERRARGLTARALGEAAGVSGSTVLRLEGGGGGDMVARNFDAVLGAVGLDRARVAASPMEVCRWCGGEGELDREDAAKLEAEVVGRGNGKPRSIRPLLEAFDRVVTEEVGGMAQLAVKKRMAALAKDWLA